MRLFTNSVRKLSTRLATWLTFGLLAGLLVLIMLAVGATAGRRGPGSGGGDAAEALLLITFPGAYDLILGFMLGLGGLFAVIYAAAVAGSEWNWGTLKTSVARGESRSRYLLATFAGIAVVMVVGLLVTFAIGVGAAILAATIAGVPLDGIGDAATLGRLPEQFARGAIAIISQGALGFAVATLARSQLAGIGIGIAIYFGGTFARIFLPDIVKYLPFQLGTAAVGGSGGFGGGGGGAAASISPDFAVLLLIVWLIGSLVVAVGFAERAEITG